MLCVFVGVYVYMSKKLGQTNLSDRLKLSKSRSEHLNETKQELEINRIKADLTRIFPLLSEEEQNQWIEDLSELKAKDSQNNVA